LPCFAVKADAAAFARELSAGDQRGGFGAVAGVAQGGAATDRLPARCAQENLRGEVKKLAGQAGRYRLRVGEYRVLFALEKT
jgi:hypothetical protein